jgi:prevent-host-death family protein
MIREISAMDARKNLGELLNEVRYLHDIIVIKKAGRPMAALIDMALFEKVTQSLPSSESLEPKDENLSEASQSSETLEEFKESLAS